MKQRPSLMSPRVLSVLLAASGLGCDTASGSAASGDASTSSSDSAGAGSSGDTLAGTDGTPGTGTDDTTSGSTDSNPDVTSGSDGQSDGAVGTDGQSDGAVGTDGTGTDGTGTDGTGTDGGLDAGDGQPLTCDNPGTVTTSTPVCDGSGTTCNVVPFECTRTGVALACELGVDHEYVEQIVGAKRKITANGVASHDVGAFPNSGNPNVISAQSYAYEVPLTPGGSGTAMVKNFGILRSGVVLDPGTAETWNDDPSWRYEALRYGTATSYFGSDSNFHPDGLGLDCNLAHVQPTGAYHYHGVPTSLIPATPAAEFIGWAADGYPIVALYGHDVGTDVSSPVREMMASYQLKAGTRPSGDAGPGGAYDGTFGADWEYVAGSGDLDACNGRTGYYEDASGETVLGYHYVLTQTFPYIPRCTTAAADPTFTAGDGGAPPGGGTGTPPGGGTGTPPGGGTGAPPTCTPGQTKCCGDGVCDGPETAANCAADCK